MKRLAVPALATLLAAATPMPAHAAARSESRNGCGYTVQARDLGYDPWADEPHEWTGVLRSNILVYSTQSPADNPVSAIVTCELRVMGTPVATATFAGTVVVTGAKRVSYTTADINEAANVMVCTTIDYTSDDTPTESFCPYVDSVPLLPDQVYDAGSDIVGAANDVIDPALCPAAASLAPGVPGVVDIGLDGNVSVNGEPFWDCPPEDPGTTPAIPVPPECRDGIDNDLDGDVDYPADTDCAGPEHDAEGLQTPDGPPPPERPCSTVESVTACASLTAKDEVARYTAYQSSYFIDRVVDAELATYEFTLPNGGTVALPCLVVKKPVAADPCAAAGGRYATHLLYLIEYDRTQYLDGPVTTVGVCTADLTVTVNGDGVSSYPAYAPC